MKKGFEVRVFRQRDGNVCEGTYGNEPKLARMLLCAIIQRVPSGGIVHDRVFGQRKLHVAQTVFPVKCGGILRLDEQRTVCALIDGVVGLHESIHAVRVREGSGQRRVAAHGGDSKKVDFGKRVRGHNGDGVIHADVAVQPDRELFHFTPSP